MENLYLLTIFAKSFPECWTFTENSGPHWLNTKPSSIRLGIEPVQSTSEDSTAHQIGKYHICTCGNGWRNEACIPCKVIAKAREQSVHEVHTINLYEKGFIQLFCYFCSLLLHRVEWPTVWFHWMLQLFRIICVHRVQVSIWIIYFCHEVECECVFVGSTRTQKAVTVQNRKNG